MNKGNIHELIDSINNHNIHHNNQDSNHTSSSNIMFPLLKNSEIIDYLKNKNINIEVNQLTSPQSMHITEVMVSIMSSLGLLKKESLSLSFDETSTFVYPNLHDRPLYLSKFFLLTKDFFKNVLMISDYKTSDVFTPNEKRVQKLLSGLISITKVYDEVNQSFLDIKNASVELDSKLQNLKEQRIKSKEEYNNTKSLVEAKKLAAENKIIYLNDMMNNMNSKTSYYESIKLKSVELSNELNSLKTNIEELEKCNQLIERNINHLISLKVSSPDKMNDSIKNQTEIINSLSFKIEKLNLLLSVFDKLSLTISTLINSISEIGTTKFTLDRLEKEEDSINKETLTNRQNLIEINDKLKLIEEECLRYQDIISNLKSDKQNSENDYTNHRRMLIDKLKELLDSITKLKLLINEKSNVNTILNKEKEKLEYDVEDLLNAEERILSDFSQKIAFMNGVALNYTGMIKKLLNSN